MNKRQLVNHINCTINMAHELIEYLDKGPTPKKLKVRDIEPFAIKAGRAMNQALNKFENG